MMKQKDIYDMLCDGDWRTELRLTPADAELVADVDVSDVLTEMILWITLCARQGSFDFLGRHRRRIRTLGWRVFASSRMLPPLIVEYEVFPAARLIVICRVVLPHSDHISNGSPQEERSLPSVVATRTLRGEFVDTSDLKFLEFRDLPREMRRDREHRSWKNCIDPAFRTMRSVRSRLESSESSEQIQIERDARRTLGLLIFSLMRRADQVPVVGDDDVREVSCPVRVLLGNGLELAPLLVRFVISPDDREVWIVDVRSLPEAGQVRISADVALTKLLEAIE